VEAGESVDERKDVAHELLHVLHRLDKNFILGWLVERSMELDLGL
jgi:hypothetical protein